MVFLTNFPLDSIGLDTCLAIQQTLMRETGDTKYRPSILLGRMVAAGFLGKKSGKGLSHHFWHIHSTNELRLQDFTIIDDS